MIYEYFKKEFEEFTILVQLNPETFLGIELTIQSNQVVEKREIQFDEEIYDDLVVDDFKSSSPLEFNLYSKGVVS